MPPSLKNLLGNGSKDRDSAEQMRAVLYEMQKERSSFEALVESARTSANRLQLLSEPITKAAADVDAVNARLAAMDERLEAIATVALSIQQLDVRASRIAEDQKQTDERIASTLAEMQRVSAAFEELGRKVDAAGDLQQRLEGFLEIEKPFKQLRGEADTIREHIENANENVGRLREQHTRLLDAHKLATQKMEALDRRREEFSRSLQDKERRVAQVEEGVRALDGVRATVDDVKREMGALKSLGDTVAQKTAALEAQREAVERAIARADHLDQAMRQVDAGVRQQQANEQALAQLQEQVGALQSLHETVLERSREIADVQRQSDEQVQSSRQHLSTLRDEMRSTVERFDFESRGLESVSERVTDLRGALTEFESRFKGLTESSQSVRSLLNQTQAVAEQLQNFGEEFARVDAEALKLQAIRRDLDLGTQTVRDVAARVRQIDEARPAIEAALRDASQLGSLHAGVRDALEQVRIAQAEIDRAHTTQGETRAWIGNVESSVATLREQVAAVRELAPAIEAAREQAERVRESLSLIESRRQFADELHQRLTTLGTLGGRLDERGQQLQQRMEAAEERMLAFVAHAEEAEQLTQSIAAIRGGVEASGTQGAELAKRIAEVEKRCASVEQLAEKTRALKAEIDQRQKAIAEATKQLQQATESRQQAAAAAQELDAHARLLREELASAEGRLEQMSTRSAELEDRSQRLLGVDRRLAEFEERLTQWEHTDAAVRRSLEQIAARQATVESLGADLDRMFAMAEKTASEVRSITSANPEIEESRTLLADVLARMRDVQETSSALDERRRQMTKAEERLQRAEALLVDVRSSLQTLEGQKAMVDQAVEKAGSLQILVKQAEAMIEGFREERKMSARVRSAMEDLRDEDDAPEGYAKAA